MFLSIACLRSTGIAGGHLYLMLPGLTAGRIALSMLGTIDVFGYASFKLQGVIADEQ